MECTHHECVDEEKHKYEDHKCIETLNSMVPIWKKNKNDVEEVDYENFYMDNCLLDDICRLFPFCLYANRFIDWFLMNIHTKRPRHTPRSLLLFRLILLRKLLCNLLLQRCSRIFRRRRGKEDFRGRARCQSKRSRRRRGR